jgi:outer membrane protein assembly factor BamB
MPRGFLRLVSILLCAAVVIGNEPAGAVAPVNWSQPGFDASHRGYNPDETVLSPSTVPGLKVLWQAPGGGTQTSSPIVDGSLAFETGAQSGFLSAFDVTTGELRWRVRLGPNMPFWSPAVAEGMVFATSWFSSDLVAMDEATGTVLWRFRMNGVSNAPPAVVSVDGRLTVYAPGGSDAYALDGTSGSMLWSRSPDPPFGLQATPTVVNGVVYVVDDQPVVHAYRASDGEELWSSLPLGTGTAAPTYAVVDGGLVFAARSGGQLFALDAATGAIIWEQQVYATSQPSAANGMVYIHRRRKQLDRLLAFDQSTGALRWEAPLGVSDVFSFGDGASIANGVAYATTPSGAIVALDAQTGAVLWMQRTPAGPTNMPAVVNGTMYAAAGGGLLKFGL